MTAVLVVWGIPAIGLIVAAYSLTIGYDRRQIIRAEERRRDDEAWLALVEEWNRPTHVHGAWCHPSADGCPDRPGM